MKCWLETAAANLSIAYPLHKDDAMKNKLKSAFILSLKEEMAPIQKKMQKYSPWIFASSLCAKLAIVMLLVAAPNCAHAQSITPGEQDVLVKNIETYMNNITTMKARFSQMSQDASVENGTFYLWRPGRLRFEYDKPNGDYIVADGLLVHYWDNGVKNYSNAPIGSTLADFLLRKKIKFSGDIKVLSLKRPQTGKLVLTLAQTKNPEAGDLRLLLNENPMRLEKWRITDGTGNITEVTLTKAEVGQKIDPRLFRFVPPKGYDQQTNQN